MNRSFQKSGPLTFEFSANNVQQSSATQSQQMQQRPQIVPTPSDAIAKPGSGKPSWAQIAKESVQPSHPVVATAAAVPMSMPSPVPLQQIMPSEKRIPSEVSPAGFAVVYGEKNIQ